jgi:hypothetical protein
MAIKLSGRVTLANGVSLGSSVTDLQARVFDYDPGPKNDDELTVEPGSTDDSGRFSLKINPSRFMDLKAVGRASGLDLQFDEANWTPDPMFDLPQPYLQFDYKFLGTARRIRLPIRPFQRSYQLPHYPPLEFLPSLNGFNFINSFPPFDPPFTLPAWLKKVKIGENYGLCGGMSSAAYDFLLAGRLLPELETPPKTGTRLHRFLLKRSIDTFGYAGEHLAKVGRWSLRPDEGLYGTQRMTMDELPGLLQRLDDHQPVVIAQVRESAKDYSDLAKKIWNNHQVLALSYKQPAENEYYIQLYDPNYRRRDDVRLHLERYQVGVATQSNGVIRPIYAVRCEQVGPANLTTRVRGFFPMNYIAALPPKRI